MRFTFRNIATLMLLLAFFLAMCMASYATGMNRLTLSPGPFDLRTLGGISKFKVTTAGVIYDYYDANAYWTATQADAGGVTFDSVSDGTAGFAFSDPLTVTSTGAQLTAKYDSAAYTTITQADAGGVTINCTSDGTASITLSDPVTCSSTLAVTGTSTLPFVPIVNEATASRSVTSADYGKIITFSNAGANTATLTDPSSATVGADFYVTSLVDQTLTIVGGSTADNNQIIADGVLTSDNVSFSTASHKIGAMAHVVGISATKWLITNASSCTMTVEAAD